MVLNRLLGLYGLKFDSATACGLPLYLCSYKLVGSATDKVASMNPPCLYMAFFQMRTAADGSVNLMASPIFGVALSSIAFF